MQKKEKVLYIKKMAESSGYTIAETEIKITITEKPMCMKDT